MNVGMYLGAAGALAAEARLDVIANNLANTGTPGFKRAFAVFQARLPEALESPPAGPPGRPVLERVGGGLLVHEVTYSGAQGPILASDSPTHLALVGDGWFTVRRGDETLFTRAGDFLRRHDGLLATPSGGAVLLDTEGRPIRTPGAGELLVERDGRVIASGTELGRLAIRGQVDPRQFAPAGDNLYRYQGPGLPPAAAAEVRQHALEASTVSPVREMVAMIQTFRAYEANQRLIRLQDQTYGRVVNDVGRLS